MTLFGPVGYLCHELWMRVPALQTAVGCSPERTPPDFLRVARPGGPPRLIVWDETGVYRWQTGPDAGGQVGVTVEQAATAVAWALGVSIL